MYPAGSTTNRCSLCYALCVSSHPLTSTFRYSSISKRHVRRCPTSAFERLISSSSKFQRLWYENDYELMKNLLICDQCYHSIEKLDNIRTNIEQLHSEQRILLNKIQHNLTKRASIVKARRQSIKHPTIFVFNHQATTTMDNDGDDDELELGEEKSEPESFNNGHQVSLPVTPPINPLVGAKRRKCNLAQKLHQEEKFLGTSALLNLAKSSKKDSSSNGSTKNGSFGHVPNASSTRVNGHDRSNSNVKSMTSSNSILPSNVSKLVPPFLDPKTGALIAIVSNPHHASLLAAQHQKLTPPSSSSSIHSADEHEPSLVKQTSQLKKFPCLLCGRDFSNKSNLNRHHSIVHVAIRNFECPRCPKKFKLRQGLKTHMQRCHGVNADEPTFVLQKHHLHNYHHHPYSSSSSSFIAQTNK